MSGLERKRRKQASCSNTQDFFALSTLTTMTDAPAGSRAILRPSLEMAETGNLQRDGHVST
jgi:hypothetical protein